MVFGLVFRLQLLVTIEKYRGQKNLTEIFRKAHGSSRSWLPWLNEEWHILFRTLERLRKLIIIIISHVIGIFLFYFQSCIIGISGISYILSTYLFFFFFFFFFFFLTNNNFICNDPILTILTIITIPTIQIRVLHYLGYLQH